jgi:hypothetical protein
VDHPEVATSHESSACGRRPRQPSRGRVVRGTRADLVIESALAQLLQQREAALLERRDQRLLLEEQACGRRAVVVVPHVLTQVVELPTELDQTFVQLSKVRSEGDLVDVMFDVIIGRSARVPVRRALGRC